MALIQTRVRGAGGQPLEQVVRAFQLVGESLARDVVMRAGIRLAKESRQAFPERRLEPTGTWEGFLQDLLGQARELGQLRPNVDVTSEVRLMLIEALVVRDELIDNQDWSSAATQLEQVGLRRTSALRHRAHAAATPFTPSAEPEESVEALAEVSEPHG